MAQLLHVAVHFMWDLRCRSMLYVGLKLLKNNSYHKRNESMQKKIIFT